MKNRIAKSLNRAQLDNKNAASFLRQFIGGSFGPKGLDKLTFNKWGDIFVIQDCKTVLEKADFKHPVAKIMLDLAKFLHAKWGDGSATCVLLACTLTEKGFDLIERGIHPSKIIDGFVAAKDEALSFLEKQRIEHSNLNRNAISGAIDTFLSSKLRADEAAHLTNVIYSAVDAVLDPNGKKFDPEMIKITAKEGESIFDSCVIDGIAVDSEVVSGSMPSSVTNARIAIVEELLDVRKTKFDVEVRIHSPESLGLLKNEENRMVEELVRPIIESGANVLLTHKGISELAQGMLADARILAARRIGLVDLRRISKATGASIVNSPKEISTEALGHASSVQQRRLAGAKWLFVEGCRSPRAVSLILRAGSQRAADELEMLSSRAIKMVEAVMQNPNLIVGGGASEFALHQHLQSYALGFSGREQIAVEAFAEAFLLIVETLARNCGIKPLDTRIQMSSLAKQGTPWINPFSRSVESYVNGGPVEPLGMKKDIIITATEVAISLLRVGDIHPAKQIQPRKEREPDYP